VDSHLSRSHLICKSTSGNLSRSLVRTVANTPMSTAGRSDDRSDDRVGDNELCGFQWQLSQAILKSQPFVAVTRSLEGSTPREIRDAAETVAQPAGYLVVTISSRGALLENIVNQILARIAVESGKVHDSAVSRKDAPARLQQLIRSPDQRIVIIIQNGTKVPADTFRSLSQALRHKVADNSLPPMIVVVGTQPDFFTTTKGKAVINALGEDGVAADDEAGMIQHLAEKAEQAPDVDTAWQLTRERIGRDPNSTLSVSESVEPSKSLVVVDPISAPREPGAILRRIRELGSLSFSFRHLFSARRKKSPKKTVARWLDQEIAADTRKTPTFHATGDTARGA